MKWFTHQIKCGVKEDSDELIKAVKTAFQPSLTVTLLRQKWNSICIAKYDQIVRYFFWSVRARVVCASGGTDVVAEVAAALVLSSAVVAPILDDGNKSSNGTAVNVTLSSKTSVSSSDGG